MAAQVIDLGQELGETRLTPFHLRLAVLLGSILFVDGYDLFNAAYVAPYVKAEWGLAPTQVGLMLSIGLVGLAVGALLQGPLADRFGRRRVLLVAVWALGGASLTLSLATPNFAVFCGLRAALGLSLGMISPLAFVYINEWAPSSCANRFATLAFVLPFSVGGIAAGVAGLTIAPEFGWRALYLVGASGLVIAVIAHTLLPESVRHLAAHGGRNELARLLARIRPERAAAYAAAERFVVGEGELPKHRWRALLGPRYRGVTLAVWSAGALSLFCLHGLTGWLPSIVLEQGAGVRTAFAYGTLLMIMQIVGGAAGGWLADRRGRVPTMAAGFVGGAVALLLLPAALTGGWGVAVVAACGFFIFGTQAVMNNFQAMSYETGLRSTAVGAAVGVNRLGGIAGPLLIGLAHETGYGLWAMLAVLAAAQLLAALIILTRRASDVSRVAVAASGR